MHTKCEADGDWISIGNFNYLFNKFPVNVFMCASSSANPDENKEATIGMRRKIGNTERPRRPQLKPSIFHAINKVYWLDLSALIRRYFKGSPHLWKENHNTMGLWSPGTGCTTDEAMEYQSWRWYRTAEGCYKPAIGITSATHWSVFPGLLVASFFPVKIAFIFYESWIETGSWFSHA